ncbi:phosphatidate cytidylyltransferase [Rhizobiaceae bacterium BDR2-2]|uniref:Phosphatidate cytidylyltransferase n=1 Tax=Ectorhizobium quercum TaxID=2965071 RepID=A0AAE3SV02_9HYPH|nr:phosphatidate cytidylyltransferase [Ectorhizobium quercum]MCX8997627.1 phosphatidate cytidylyltransferase [Ectorhizobium quercum]
MSQELRLRILSGIVMAIVVLSATWVGGFAFRLLAAAIALLVYYEWSTITRFAPADRIGGWIAVAIIAGAVLLDRIGLGVALLAAFTLAGMFRTALSAGSQGWLPGGILYAGLTGLSLAAIRGDDAAGLAAMLFVFALVWATDILAYFVGRAIGGPKLAPRISPGKTWSGAVGGTISAVIAGCAVALLLTDASPIWIVPAAFILSVASQAGDLFESFIKRRFGVKDSSRLIPGHGGVMDRVDGLVVACFAAFVLMAARALMAGGSFDMNGGMLLGL